MKKILYSIISIISVFLVGSAYADSTISEVDYTAATFADKYRDLLQQGGQRVSVLIKVAGDVETIDPTIRAKEIRYLQNSLLKFLSFSNGINVISDSQKNEITAQIHPHWIEILEDRADVVSITILGQFEYSGERAISPLKQTKQGIPFTNIVCNKNLELIKKYDGSAACVKPETKQKLLERGWAIQEFSINNFEECAAAGNPIMESYPRQCRTPDGKHFVEEIETLN